MLWNVDCVTLIAFAFLVRCASALPDVIRIGKWIFGRVGWWVL